MSDHTIPRDPLDGDPLNGTRLDGGTRHEVATAHVGPPATTHAAWGSGHPTLLVSHEDDRMQFPLQHLRTTIGASEDCDLMLTGADAMHAAVEHDDRDEYVLTMYGTGNMSGMHEHPDGTRDMTLRTGSRFTIAQWSLVFVRDEYADHGRPYGGRQGGEGGHQRRQPPRPDYGAEFRAESALEHPEYES